MAQFPYIQHWYIAGHSMGGAMASQFASEYPDEVDGLLLLGAYLYGDYPPAATLTVYGSLNQSVEDKIDYTENVVEIEGGNHAQFGNYGPQKGDLPATISAEEQQAQTVEAILLPNARSERVSFKKGNFMAISPWATSLTLIVYTRRKI